MTSLGKLFLCASALLTVAVVCLPSQAAQTQATLTTATGTLHGTLLVPDGFGTPIPVALIIAGSGPTNRDGSNPMGVTVTPYHLLADALAARGIASLRYDKRGIAASAASAPIASGVTFDAYVHDVAGWVRQLRADRRFSRVVLIGHSEGSLLSLLAARTVSVDRIVSLEGAGRPALDIIDEQIRAARVPEATVERARAIGNAIRDGKDPGTVPADLAALYPPYLRTYERQWFSVDPAQVARSLSAPLLVVQGGADIQVSEVDAHRLADAHTGAMLRTFPKMTHVLVDANASDRASSLATYNDASLPLDPAMVDTVAAFILQKPLPPGQ